MTPEVPASHTVRPLLLARTLTATGDQAWEMALPLAIAALYPGDLRVVAALWLVLRLAQAVGVQQLAAVIDAWPARRVLRTGVLGQTVGVAATWLTLASLLALRQQGLDERWLWPVLAVSQTTTSLGAALMDVAVAQDWLPRLVPAQELSKANVRLRQIDLAAEVLMPVLAGLVLMGAPTPLLGLLAVALWNLLSFVPEYMLLHKLLRHHPGPRHAYEAAAFSWTARLHLWRSQPVFGAMAAYALLWSTVLTPHGAVLTAYLRSGGGLQEAEVGLFRGLGALAGVAGAQLHHAVRRSWPLVATTRAFVLFQTGCIGLGAMALQMGWLWPFLFGVILSRVGLFGFNVGEVEIRQRGVPDGVRGRVSGLSGSVNQSATLLVLGLAVALPSTADFPILAWFSAGAVALAAIVFVVWSKRPAAVALDQQTAAQGLPPLDR